jgi:hypothetical protein
MRPVGIGVTGSDVDVLAPEALNRTAMGMNAAAKASMVNRTHRVVRERAKAMQANRSRNRGLLLPLVLCSTIMIFVFSAFWMVVEQYESLSSEPSAYSHHHFLLLLWFVPVSGGLLGMVWFRRSRNQSDAEATR